MPFSSHKPSDRTSVSAYLESIAAGYRRAVDLELAECRDLAVSAYLRDIRRVTGARISRSSAIRLVLGEANVSSQTITVNVP